MNDNGNTGKQQEVRQICSEIFIFGPSVSTGLTLVFGLTKYVEIKSDLKKKKKKAYRFKYKRRGMLIYKIKKETTNTTHTSAAQSVASPLLPASFLLPLF